MTLDRYLISTKTTSRQFAQEIGATIYAVRKWRQGLRIPRAEHIRLIEKVTKNKVKPKDWY